MRGDAIPTATSRRRLAGHVSAFATGLLLCLAATAAAAGGGGGTTAPGEPQVSDVVCLTKCIKTRLGVVGSRFKLTGSDLSQVTVVSLPRSDGTRAKDLDPLIKPSGAVLAYAKKGAVSGAIRVGASRIGTVVDTDAVFKIGTKEQLKKAQSGWRFPILGPHDYGGSGARFGAPRSGHAHQGQDVMAACGTRLVAGRGGKVQYVGFQSSAGNYIVIDGYKDPYDYVYMHLLKPALPSKGQVISTGQALGKVGQTGDATGCHLHFEIWAPPGWYEGGKPIDPLKTLKYWDSFS